MTESFVHVTTFYKKGWKKDLSNYRPVSLTLVRLEKVVEKVILIVTMLHAQDNQGIRPSQHRLMKSRFCLANLISFYDQLTRQVSELQSI